MYLKYLEIQGFKSFPDKTKLTFGREITAIVGPNGSGKSNISDAVRWVLGEQSSKSLRSGKMEDVIFGGTRLRNPMGYALVTLCLDNTDNRIVDLGDEITVTRRYYRSGDSEYLLNGNIVRLRDVRETFMDTGLSRYGYSIIEQGRISDIVASRNTANRREILEEASGISKFRFRKNEAERKLIQTEDNISRLTDILGELTTHLGPLKVQSEKAHKFLELAKQQRELQITLYCDTIERTRKSVHDQEDRIAIAQLDYNNIELEIKDIDDEFQSNYERNVELIRITNQANETIAEANLTITSLERSLAMLENDILHLKERETMLSDNRDSLTLSDSDMNQKLSLQQQQLTAQKANLLSIQGEIDETQILLDLLSDESSERDTASAQITEHILELQDRLTELKLKVASRQSETEINSRHVESLDQQLPQIASRVEELSERLKELKEFSSENQQAMTSDQNQKNGYLMKQNLLIENLNSLESELHLAEQRRNEITVRIEALEGMERNMEGYAPSVRSVIEASRSGTIRGIIGPISSLLTINKGCEIAIETALGAGMQNIVVSDEQAAKDAIRMLRDSRTGRATFLPLDTVQPSSFNARDITSIDGVIGVASSLVTYDGRYENVVSNLLGRIIITEDIDSASQVAKKLNYRNRVVTTDGQVINAGGSFTGGFTSRTAGVFSRRSEIDSLTVEHTRISSVVSDLTPKIDELRQQLTSVEASLTVIDADLLQLSADRIRIDSELHFMSDELQASVVSQERLSEEKQHTESTIIEAFNDIEQAKIEQQEIEQRIEQHKLTATAAVSSSEAFILRREELNELLLTKKIRMIESSKDVEILEVSIETIRSGLVTEQTRVEDILQLLEALQQQLDSNEAAIIDKQKLLEVERQNILALEATIADAVEERLQLEGSGNEKREQQNQKTKLREDLAAEISRLQERKESLGRDYDNAVASLWEDYELTRSEASELCVEFSSITELRQDVSQLQRQIRALGTVYVGAIEEYKEVELRHSTLTTQLEDVIQSKQKLISIIDSITKEMRTLFIASFEAINSSFGMVFVEMFSGGSASLSLSDESDILGCDIDIDVQPPGKVIKNLTLLSGGEQALVSIALYFAILSVNPAPFCVLDEIDSALDEINVQRFASYLARLVSDTQLISITHRRGTMQAADVLYGVTMQEEGVSKVLKLTASEATLIVSN
ncbi:MAG: chromosome segregation protein SMC [Oscillospiraceae bacterium]|nr:chromosome segregation protein SMC [Oscillospiraceae bacterium]